ncbi:MAG: helix-turn-helix domain-containing protein [Acetobacteraceae bacterium]
MSERTEGGVLPLHDVSDLIGLAVLVVGAVRETIEPDGEVSYEVPDLHRLASAAAVARCLMPPRLRGSELRAIRHIAGWTAEDLARRLGEKTATVTISRWENEKQPMGGYVEKVIRLAVCEALHKEATGVDYHAQAIAELAIVDPWRPNPEFKLPPLVFGRVKMRDEERRLIEAWEPEARKAA